MLWGQMERVNREEGKEGGSEMGGGYGREWWAGLGKKVRKRAREWI